MTPPRAGLLRIVAASLFAAACSDAVAPTPRPPSIGGPEFDVAASDRVNSSVGQTGTAIIGAFATNPHHGDAVVEYVQAGGISMATYVATNVQNFPDTNDSNTRLLVRATLSSSVTDGGI